MPIGPWKILRERNYALVWAAGTLGSLGTWMQIGALGIYVTESTGQARWTGIASTITYVGLALMMPFGGVLADRYDRRRLVAVVALGQCAVAMGMAAMFAADMAHPALLVTLSGLLGLCSAASAPARFAIVADVVPEERLANATLLDQVAWNAGRAVGPAMAVMIVNSYSYSVVFAIDAMFCLVLALTMPLLRDVVQQGGEVAGSVFTRVHAGWQGLRERELCKWPIAISFIDMAFIAPYVALAPVMGVLVLDAGKEGAAALFVAQGIGSVIGSLVVGTFMHRYGQGRTTVAMACALPVALLAYAMSPTITVAVVLIAPLSALHTSVFAINLAMVQRFAGTELRARVTGIGLAMTNLAYAIASTALGALADVFGLRVTLAVSAGVAALTLFGMAAFRVNRLALIALSDRQATPIREESAVAANV